jgi:tetratricopeptide (TPR) repeat protein
MEYVIDPDSSYIELSENDSAVDFLQFPQQTLDFRTGDCDDLSILYAALLESLGIRTAFVTIPGHIYLAFALDMDERQAKQTFTRSDELIYFDDEAWVPVEVTLLQGNFLQAWSTGAKQWRENAATDTAEIYPVRSAWKTYPPTGFASEALALDIPQTTQVVPNYTALLKRFVEREIAPQVVELEDRIARSGGSPRLINRLGTVYARYGLYEEAQDTFLRVIAETEYRPALINLGNLAYLRENLDEALAFYRRAADQRQDDPLTLISLARVHFDLSQYPPATEHYRKAEVLAPELAQRFSYIISENQEAGRASSAQERNVVIWDEE